MCGICGIVSVSEFRQPESARLWTDAMLEALVRALDAVWSARRLRRAA